MGRFDGLFVGLANGCGAAEGVVNVIGGVPLEGEYLLGAVEAVSGKVGQGF